MQQPKDFNTLTYSACDPREKLSYPATEKEY